MAESKRLKFDIGLVVPLREEFRYIVEVAPILESISHEGTYFYRLDFGTISALCCLVDQMGVLPALQSTYRLLGFADIKLLAVLGIGGGLDDDISVGDVVIATEVNEFQANSKAESVGQTYEVRYSGRHWPLEFQIREAISHFEFSGQSTFLRWQRTTANDYERIDNPNKESVCSSPSKLHLGPIASGNVVAASSAFVAEVKRINRKFVAIDMESAGVVPAAVDRIHPLPCIIIRGISDRANEGKKALDEQGKNVWRRYCLRNATNLLLSLLTWEGFLTAAGLSTPKLELESTNMATELATRLKSCVGGPWIVGVVFEIYSHGPRESEGRFTPMDLSGLRVSDVRVATLLDGIEKLRDALFLHGDLQLAAEGFETIVKHYRRQLNSAAADGLLKGFDKVVLAILCPEREDEEVESMLLQADRLEEEMGTEAVIELLRERVIDQPRLRERYLDALATSKKWPEIAEVARQIESSQLTRRELEHVIFACAKSEWHDFAIEMLRRHKDQFNDNASILFRRELIRLNPKISGDAPGGLK